MGTARRGKPIPIEFRNNTIVSNFANFNMQDSYGVANNYRFVGNKFVKVGERADYATIRARSGYASTGHVFRDSTFEGGAGYDKSTARRNVDGFTVQWTLTISTTPDAKVSIKDKNDKVVFSGNVPAEGKIAVPLTQYIRQGDGITPVTPHTVTVLKDGKTVSKTVEMDGKKDVRLAP